MKNQLIFITLITFSLSVKAQIYGTIEGTSSNNNVGIGTSNATAKLTIQAGPDGYPTPLKAISIWGPNSPENSNSAQAISWDFAAAGSAALRCYRGGNWDTYMQFLTNSNSASGNYPQVRMHITGEGNVGIGTTDPSTLLNVNVGTGGLNGIAGIKVGGLNNYSSLELGVDGDYDGMIRSFGNNINYYAGHWKVKGVPATENHSHNWYTSKNGSVDWSVAKMILDQNGNLGIGTTNPDEKLTVNGKIHAQEVRIDLSSPMTVPDYVFANDYKLKSLQEVEDYIKENSHLPEIPSAKEIEKNGLMLAEMNMSLLKKIEELTLYAIEQEKNTTKLIQLLDEQNKRLKILEEGKK